MKIPLLTPLTKHCCQTMQRLEMQQNNIRNQQSGQTQQILNSPRRYKMNSSPGNAAPFFLAALALIKPFAKSLQYLVGLPPKMMSKLQRLF